MTPTSSRPPRSSAIDTPNVGSPATNAIVPSSGSTIQRPSGPFATAPPSSPRNPIAGNRRWRSRRIVRSASPSARVTGSRALFSRTGPDSAKPTVQHPPRCTGGRDGGLRLLAQLHPASGRLRAWKILWRSATSPFASSGVVIGASAGAHALSEVDQLLLERLLHGGGDTLLDGLAVLHVLHHDAGRHVPEER